MTELVNLRRIKAQYRLRLLILDLIMLVALAMTVALTVLCASLGRRAYSQPSFIEISTDGTAYYVPDGRKLLEDWTPSELIQERFLKTFIQSLRSVSQDPEENYDNLGKALYRSSGQAFTVVSNFITENPTIDRAKSETVTVPYEDIELTSYGENIWRIVWREISQNPYNGEILYDKQYDAVFYTAYVESVKGDELRRWNPTGMFVIYMDSDLLQSYL